ncbi:Isopropylmalate/homocitrate/citramalate synthase LeuA family [Methanonatronarchaeum thermophilum]|uniref:2-isopropylmalate synthase n=2 Tax=Methanonatronarchaeum thermophilum TaxID=1927129 RepID=A0A1Y3GC17_9EURY|nr:Isopropylmalate/homocitrate/citramalate synthase LeuA family [Methanonatronarchaeum thermophilum]
MFYTENKDRKIRIFDTTLRDGEQTPGVSLSIEDKINIANQLDALNVDVIEVGFPSSSKGEMDSAKKIIQQNFDTNICGLARAKKTDIDACIEAGVDTIHLFISTSDIQLKHTIKKTKKQVKEIIADQITYLKDHDVNCLFSAMDATRTDLDYLIDVYQKAEQAGADTINVPDTVGITTPHAMGQLIKKISKEISIPIDIHCHNDFGLAVANSLHGIEFGASQVQTTINGIGERAGNASLQQTVMGIECLLNLQTNIKTEKLYETSKLVERLTGIPILPNTPIIGENAFSHESGIHAQGVISDSETFEPGIMTPEMVGHKRRLVPGKHVGRHAVKTMLSDAGLNPNEEQLNEIVSRVKNLGDKGKKVTDVDLYTIAEVVMNSVSKKVIDLQELAVMTGNQMTPTASIKAKIEGKEKRASDIGVGPVDAAINAAQSLVGEFPNISLKTFKVEAITGGSDAIAEIIIEVEDSEGRTVTARSESEDIVMASVDALISGMNRLMIEKQKNKNKQ